MDPLKLVPNVSYPPYQCTHWIPTHIRIISSCLAHPDSLDTPCRHRSAIHTNVLLGLHDEETLRKVYGIVPGATVSPLNGVGQSLLRPISPTHHTSLGPIYLN